MMNIVIKETGKADVLSLTINGTECASDIIGNWDALGEADYQFDYDDEYGVYRCTQSTFDWWDKQLAKMQELEDRIADLKEEHGFDAVNDVLILAGVYNDLEDMTNSQIAALDEAFPVHAGN